MLKGKSEFFIARFNATTTAPHPPVNDNNTSGRPPITRPDTCTLFQHPRIYWPPPEILMLGHFACASVPRLRSIWTWRGSNARPGTGTERHNIRTLINNSSKSAGGRIVVDSDAENFMLCARAAAAQRTRTEAIRLDDCQQPKSIKTPTLLIAFVALITLSKSINLPVLSSSEKIDKGISIICSAFSKLTFSILCAGDGLGGHSQPMRTGWTESSVMSGNRSRGPMRAGDRGRGYKRKKVH